MTTRSTSPSSLRSLAGHGRLTVFAAHLCLALSARKHLLISLPRGLHEETVCDSIHDFSDTLDRPRKIRCIIPYESAQSWQSIQTDDLLRNLFITEDTSQDSDTDYAWRNRPLRPNGRAELPDLLVLGDLDQYTPPLQAALNNLLRDRRFELGHEVYNLPDDFLIVGSVSDGRHEHLSHHVVRAPHSFVRRGLMFRSVTSA